jgi:PrtD family type I secretion system ABC transporter
MAARNVEVVDGMGMNAALANRWALDNVQAGKLQKQASDSGGLVHATTKSFRLALQLVVLGAGAYLAVANELSPGAMIAASIIMGRALAPVELAIGTWRQAIGAAESYRRLRTVLATPPLRPESLRLPRPRGFVSSEQVTYVPPGRSEPIIREASFRLSPGEALGIVGPSGAGKTTLARLIVGTLKPTRGLVRIDGADVFARSRAEVGPWMGYLPQDVELFDGTVAENIARMSDVDARQVVRAAELADAHEMILRLPKGYDTPVGEGGAQLSGGQRQRIGLARALLGSPALVVLDEPNSNLDAEGEHALNTAIANLKSLGSTVIVIGHRPSVMLHVDKILVLRDGRVDLFGTKQSVLEKITRPDLKVIPETAAAVGTRSAV